MDGFSIPSTGIILFTAGLEVEASAARASVDVLSPLGIFVSSNLSNCWVISFRTVRYASILSFFASYSMELARDQLRVSEGADFASSNASCKS